MDKELPGQPAVSVVFFYDSRAIEAWGTPQLLEALVNQQAKYECGQDS